MSMRCGLFDSTEIVTSQGGYPVGNKSQSADFFARYFSSFVGTGVFATPQTSFQVLPYSANKVQIRPGSAFINGYFCFDDAVEYKEFESLPEAHVHSLVLRLDLTNGEISKLWITDGGNLPLRTSSVYDLLVAKVSVPASCTAITDAMIDDMRADESVCGYVGSITDKVGFTIDFTNAAMRARCGLGNAAVMNVGVASGTVAAGNHTHTVGAADLTPGAFSGAMTVPSGSDFSSYKLRNIALKTEAEIPADGNILGVYE